MFQFLFWSEHEGVVISAFDAVAGDLTNVIDGVGVDEDPSGVGRDKRVQILHASRRGPAYCADAAVREVAIADDYAEVVHSEGDAISATLEHAEILNLVGSIPQNGMPLAARASAVGLTDDNPVGEIGRAHV